MYTVIFAVYMSCTLCLLPLWKKLKQQLTILPCHSYPYLCNIKLKQCNTILKPFSSPLVWAWRANPGHTLLLDGSLYCQPVNTLNQRANGGQRKVSASTAPTPSLIWDSPLNARITTIASLPLAFWSRTRRFKQTSRCGPPGALPRGASKGNLEEKDAELNPEHSPFSDILSPDGCLG